MISFYTWPKSLLCDHAYLLKCIYWYVLFYCSFMEKILGCRHGYGVYVGLARRRGVSGADRSGNWNTWARESRREWVGAPGHYDLNIKEGCLCSVYQAHEVGNVEYMDIDIHIWNINLITSPPCSKSTNGFPGVKPKLLTTDRRPEHPSRVPPCALPQPRRCLPAPSLGLGPSHMLLLLCGTRPIPVA